MPEPAPTTTNPPTEPTDAEKNFAALRAKFEKQQEQTLSLAAKMAGYDPQNPTTKLIIREFAKKDDVEFNDESFLAFAKDEMGFAPQVVAQEQSTEPPPPNNGQTVEPTAIDQLHNSGTSTSEPSMLDDSDKQIKAGDIRGSITTKVNAILGDPSKGIRPKITQDNPYIL